jgi:sugar lactone lactonase YvrE
MKLLKWILLSLLVLILSVLALVKLSLGGGSLYPDISTAPAISDERVTTPIALPFPSGMVASSPDGRIFYTYHSLHQPERFSDATVFEWVNGEGVPFPSVDVQAELVGSMGITIDHQNRFWIVIPAPSGNRLLAFDMESREKLVDHKFAEGINFAQDMRVSSDGNTVYLADTGLLTVTPAQLIVFDVPSLTSRRVLIDHPSTRPQDWVIRKTDGSGYRVLGGLITVKIGVDGIALSDDDQWIYYGAISHDSAYRVPTSALLDSALSVEELSATIERVGQKPMSDGIELLPDNTLILTDIENGGIASLSPDGQLTTLVKRLPEIDWADSVTVQPDGTIWFTDSRLADLADPLGGPADAATLAAGAPYFIYRVEAASP